MNQYERPIQALAVGLSALTGFVDAIGFIKLGGFFVSFMSGNSTGLAGGLAQGSTQVAIAAGPIATFILGVVLGSLTGRNAGHARRPIVLILVGVLLAVAAILDMLGLERCAIASMALAMGVENTIFEENDDVRISLTYMTGTLVKLGQCLAAMLMGGERTAGFSTLPSGLDSWPGGRGSEHLSISWPKCPMAWGNCRIGLFCDRCKA
jgi:uncharacterized membrane protein YoaK (UPF0700 family)